MLNLRAADLIEIHHETATLCGTKISGEKTKQQMGKLFTKISYVSFLSCHFQFKNNPPVKFKLIKKLQVIKFFVILANSFSPQL